jgi:predicted ATPase/DNA-binding CsgD family transcriptional regulator
VADAPGRSALQRLTAHLAARDLLVVLDNCEHLIEGCAALSEAVLRSCPGVSVLATSREALGVGGEVAWKIPPLRLPDRNGPPRGALSSYDAVQLFVDRAVKARPNFSVTNATAAAVAEICARLDGIPLAIELAAARTRILTPKQILAGLEDRFRFLTGGARGAMPRQQTLEASVAWSHDLLGPDERVLFRRLAVFAGGFTLDAAESVGSGVGAELESSVVLDLLDGLVGKSLVVVVDDADGLAARYRMLETVRDFAALALARAEETADARDAHLRWCSVAARQAERDLVGISREVLARVGAEQANFRAALEWALGGAEPSTALELAACHAFVLIQRGRHREAQEALRRALAVPDAPPGPRSEALWQLALAQFYTGDFAAMRAAIDEVHDLAVAASDRRMQGRAQQLRALANMFLDPPAFWPCSEAARSLAEETGDMWAQMEGAANCASVANRADDPEAAAMWVARALALTDAHGNHWWASWTFWVDACAAVRTGDLPHARAAAQRAVELAEGLGDVALRVVVRVALAEVELMEGHAGRALRLVEPAIQECTEAACVVAVPLALTLRARALWTLDSPGTSTAMQEAVAAAAPPADPWQRGPAALALAQFLVSTGTLPEAEPLLADARACGTFLGSPYLPAAADHVGALLAAARGRPDQAEHLHHAALAVHVSRGYALGVVDSLEGLACLAASQESWSEAARLLGATAARRHALGYVHGRTSVARAEALARAGLGDASYQAAFAEGQALTIDEAVAYASRARGERKRPSSGWGSLTPTELDVARLAAQGMSNAEIGTKLFISSATAKVHLSHIYAKLNLANRAQLTREVTHRQE